jgi:hypothetical protein
MGSCTFGCGALFFNDGDRWAIATLPGGSDMHTFRVWSGLEPNETVLGLFTVDSVSGLSTAHFNLYGASVTGGKEGIYRLESPDGSIYWAEEQ